MRCRDKNTSSRRVRRGQSPVDRSFRVTKPAAVSPRPFDYAAVFNAVNNSSTMTLPQRNLAPYDRIPSNIFTYRPFFKADPHSSCSTGFECTVYSDTFPSTEFPQLQAYSHKPRVCREYSSGYLVSQVGNTSWDRIVCPYDSCGVLVGHDDMKRLASEDTYTRYDEISIRSVLSDTPNFRHCLRTSCNSGQIHDSGAEGNIFRCIACDFLVYTMYDEAFHTGKTCTKYDKRKSCERKVDDDASADKIAGTTKQCSSEGCGVRIEKNSGCDHMKCRRCNHNFCWVCFASCTDNTGVWRVGNHAHQRTCSHWRENPIARLTVVTLPTAVGLLGGVFVAAVARAFPDEDEDDWNFTGPISDNEGVEV